MKDLKLVELLATLAGVDSKKVEEEIEDISREAITFKMLNTKTGERKPLKIDLEKVTKWVVEHVSRPGYLLEIMVNQSIELDGIFMSFKQADQLMLLAHDYFCELYGKEVIENGILEAIKLDSAPVGAIN